jgi:hypothetical protein
VLSSVARDLAKEEPPFRESQKASINVTKPESTGNLDQYPFVVVYEKTEASEEPFCHLFNPCEFKVKVTL